MTRMICFKSLPEFFVKERDGVKPNTLRKFDKTEHDRRLDLIEMYLEGEIADLFIQIINSENEEERFERMITDITEYKGWYIISWNPNKV